MGIYALPIIERLHARTARSCCMAKNSMATVGNLSDYYYSLLSADSKKQYKQKITLFEGQNSYVMVKNNQLNQTDHFPDFRY